MRLIAGIALTLALAACAHASAANQTPQPAATRDAALAERLGADERGMRQYVLVILRTGPYTPPTPEERSTLFAGHFANIQRLADEGKLIIAGPIGQNERQYRGVFVFAVATIEEAQALVATDPTVAAGVFVAELYPWYGSAALMETPDIHRRIAP
ncbi:MAG: hypothetical protein A4S17_03940 [Proteobacteria bacterium HN_bin10]|nr:MAG: hypothetical protein A4S17_03940 [Proteobacteria bacterium HN_bin10]